MSFNPADHMVDEDASDLQFPKDKISSNQTTLKCEKCTEFLSEPYINCAKCFQLFCLKCFSRGAETEIHKNDDPYYIRHDNVIVFPDTNWSGREEKQFLNALSNHGFGNWEGISKVMDNRTPTECKEHYLNCYFDGTIGKLLGLTNENLFVPNEVPFLYKRNSQDPPRFDVDTINFKNMAGYYFARSEFETPFDNSAEIIVSHLKPFECEDVESQEAMDELNSSIFRAYNHRLKERHRRHKIMRNHGLIIPRKILAWMSKNSNVFANLRTPNSSTGRLIAFMQLCDGMSFDFLVESLKYAVDTKVYLQRLCDLRKQGITSFAGGKMYIKLKSNRNMKIRDKHWDQYEYRIDWRNLIPGNLSGNRLVESEPVFPLVPNRKKSLPLDIIGLPGYDSLSDSEKIICSNVRLPPEIFLAHKNAMVQENSNRGYLRLADARRLIKIDVNKTRQIYDYLLENGFINKSPH